MRCIFTSDLVGWLSCISLLLGCEREARLFIDRNVASTPAVGERRAEHHPAAPDLGPTQAIPTRVHNAYDDNAWAVNQGKLYYAWFNCSGCHAQGGGGEGPALMDSSWRYGSSPSAIFATIIDGRPNGMPAFRGKIPEQQVWQLVAYVRALGGFVRLDVQPGRSDALQGHPAEAMLEHGIVPGLGAGP
jgi:cytochrome c oxidase cbb3-type subunit 3